MIISVFDGEFLPINGLLYAVPTIVVALVFYLLRSIGLWTLAKKNGVKKAFIAWIPCVWIYVVCRLIGKVKLFGRVFKWTTLVFTILFAIAELLTLAYNFLVYFPLVGYYLQGGTIYYDLTGEGLVGSFYQYATDIYTDLNFKNPYGEGMGVFLRVMYYAINVFDLVSLFISFVVFFDLFRKFWPQHYVLAGMFSALFGLFPIFVFIVRNKPAVDYNEYIRRRYGVYYGNPYGPYGPYGQGGPNGGNGNPNAQNPSGNAEPFGEYAEKPKNDEPFPEFGEDKKD